MLITRLLQNVIVKNLFKGDIIVVYGARQVGKTTLAKSVLSKYSKLKTRYLNCDEEVVRQRFAPENSAALKAYIGDFDLVVIDEAQRIENIGLKLKLLHDNFPEIQLIVTGSSALELSGKISDSLTGRKQVFHLYPLSLKEVESHWSEVEIKDYLTKFMIFGSYPKVLSQSVEYDSLNTLSEITESYLYRDVLEFQKVKNSQELKNLLQALALQIGKEVSYTKLAKLLNLDVETIQKYVNLLELSFVIFKLTPLSRNLRNEINKSRKIYFYDLGVRNSLINNFNPLNLRPDVGSLWENLMILEKMKVNEYEENKVNRYFWRTYEQVEIDYIEESNGQFNCFEFKYGISKTPKIPSSFVQNYNLSKYQVVNPNNWYEFLY